MTFEEERLNILERVSAGELTPQEGSLQIAMLKVKYQDAEEAPPETAAAEVSRGGAWRERFEAAGMPPTMKFSWPLLLGLAVPVLVVVGMGLSLLAFLLALPTLALVLVWNAVVPALSGPAIAYWPTLGVVMLVVVLTSIARARRRMRVFIGL